MLFTGLVTQGSVYYTCQAVPGINNIWEISGEAVMLPQKLRLVFVAAMLQVGPRFAGMGGKIKNPVPFAACSPTKTVVCPAEWWFDYLIE